MENDQSETRPVALVVGATGIAGGALVERLAADPGWEVHGLSRSPGEPPQGASAVAADLLDPEVLTAALQGLRPTHVFYVSWIRRETEAENCETNTAMMRHLFDALRPAGSVRHVALMTGLKHYLGPFEAYGQGAMPDTPFREDAERLPGRNFYYEQEDELFAAAARDGFTWSVHRAHTVAGFVTGNAMNMTATIGAAAAIARERGEPLTFPGSRAQWDGVVDLTDADLLAEHMVWASTTPAAANHALNVVDGDVFRWRRLWPRVAAHLGVAWEPPGEEPAPFAERFAGAHDEWTAIAEREGLAEPDLDRVASFWHTDADLGRPFECFADMGLSRELGWTGHVRTEEAFLRKLERYREARVLP